METHSADNKTVFGRVVFIVVLVDEPTAGLVVSLSLAPSTVLHLVPLEIRIALDNLNKHHF